MRSALLLTGMIIAESIFSITLGDSRDNPQSALISATLGIFIAIFLAMDVYELFKKHKV